MDSGQIIATSPDLTSKGSWGREIPLFHGNLGWWNTTIWPDGFHTIYMYHLFFPMPYKILKDSTAANTERSRIPINKPCILQANILGCLGSNIWCFEWKLAQYDWYTAYMKRCWFHPNFIQCWSLLFQVLRVCETFAFAQIADMSQRVFAKDLSVFRFWKRFPLSATSLWNVSFMRGYQKCH